MQISDITILAGIGLIFIISIWQHFFVDLFWLWLLPLVIAKVIMDWYINFLPHTGLPPDRFLGTRIIDVRFFTPWVLCHNYHAVHHLWPTIPWHSYIARYRARFEYLIEHGVPIETRFWGGRTYPALPVDPTKNIGSPRSG